MGTSSSSESEPESSAYKALPFTFTRPVSTSRALSLLSASHLRSSEAGPRFPQSFEVAPGRAASVQSRVADPPAIRKVDVRLGSGKRLEGTT